MKHLGGFNRPIAELSRMSLNNDPLQGLNNGMQQKADFLRLNWILMVGMGRYLLYAYFIIIKL